MNEGVEMNHVIIDKINGIIIFKTVPPEPIDVEFRTIDADTLKPQEPVLTTKMPQLKKYPLPDKKLLEKGEYISSRQAALILGSDIDYIQHLALCDYIPAYRRAGSRNLLFLMTDVIDRLNKDK